jgi:hypothetical protein
MASVRRTQRHSGGIPDSPVSREPGVTRAFFQAIDHLETLVDSLDRLLRLVGALEQALELGELAGMPLPSGDERERVRQFRNRIAHGDEDIERGLGRTSLPRPSDQMPPGSNCNGTGSSTRIWPACSNRSTTTCGRLSKSRHSDGLPRTSAPAAGISCPVAEGVGFEPTVDQTAHNGFRDRADLALDRAFPGARANVRANF